MPRIRDKVFISYSRKDKKWLNKLNDMLAPLLRANQLEIWDDSHILAGSNWRNEIKRAIDSAGVAVLLVSADFLASDYIDKHELAPVLDAAEKDGMTILWIAVGYCLVQYTELDKYQALNLPSEPLNSLSTAKLQKELTRICKKIKADIDRHELEAEVNDEGVS